MPELSAMIDGDNQRHAVLRDGDIDPAARTVLLWVQRAQRGSGNLAANLAIEIANELNLPLVAAFCLVPRFPRATLRAYHFVAEGLRELPEAFAARGIGWVLRGGEPAEVIPALARELAAALVVTDVAPTRPPRDWKAAVADRLTCPMVAVDADVVVPSALFPTLEWAPRTIRPKIQRVLDGYLVPVPDPIARHHSGVREAPDPFTLIAGFDLDRAVGPSPRLVGGRTAALARFRRFLDDHLATYDADRNRSHVDGSSGLSPYLHYGHIAPLEVAVAAREAGIAGAALDAFLDELIVQRELAINFALREPAHDAYAGLPDWGKKTLAKHAGDPRPVLYDRETLETGRTADRLWNAAQRQMVHEGWMPNRLRMYWAKQFLRWTASPEEAFATAVALNDRYFLDGRDANGYAGIAWAIGGRHDRPFPPEKPILGLVRPMGLNGVKRYVDVEAYISGVETRYG